MPMQLQVPKIACASCVETVTKAVHSLDPNARIEVDIKNKIVNVETQKPETAVREAIASAGYPVV